MSELVFNTFETIEDRGVTRGKAQALYAIINLPNELRELKEYQEVVKKQYETEV